MTSQGIVKDNKINPEKYFILWTKIQSSLFSDCLYTSYFNKKFLGLREKEAGP